MGNKLAVVAVSSPAAVVVAKRRLGNGDGNGGKDDTDDQREETVMTDSFGKTCVALFVVGVLASHVTGDIAPMAVLAVVAFAVFCVHQGFRR